MGGQGEQEEIPQTTAIVMGYQAYPYHFLVQAAKVPMYLFKQ